MFAQRYRIKQPLGRGSHGEVYRAVDTHQDDRVVALKLLNPSTIGPWAWREASLLTRLQSEYVLPIYNADTYQGVPFLVTGLATRGALDRAGELPRLWVPDVVSHVGCAARGLARMHDSGIVHRDIKPSNIFLSADGTAVVGDFGLAHQLDPSGNAPPHGTAATKAPEVASSGNSSPQSDIWSLGATIYQLLTGVFPHQDLVSRQTPEALLDARRRIAPTRIRELAPHVSRNLAATVEKALAPDPANRHASMTVFDTSLSSSRESQRVWRETIPHDGHLSCWESKDSVTVCKSSGTTSARVDLETRRSSTGNRIRTNCSYDDYERTSASRLRHIFDDLGT